ncbi:MAG: cysteine--tRNA ligase [Candidatus Gracilibacteria bacterium]|jgi:cysteinyl-tRNA synthetase
MIQIYDSLKGQKVPFNKKPGEEIKMYVCGPTVYDFAHLGHGRSAVAFDLVRRFLEFSGFEVVFTFNTTDIEDKMITRAAKEGITVDQLAEKIIPEYKADYAALGVKAPTHNPRATEFVEPMINLIKKLEEKGHSYELSDGIYFDIKTFPEYGKLSHQNLDELNAGARVEERTDKRNHQDFVLWKFKKEGEPFWASPWGDGRPGWHIECSAMSSELLGESFDIHGGGLDLKFPHHECEIAQSEAASGKPLADIWMHNGYITVNEEKMSKSLGNFFTLKEIFKEVHPRVVRFFLLGTHYRSPIEYSLESLEQAKNTLKRLDEFTLRHLDGTHEKDNEVDTELLTAFTEKLENDFDSAGALAMLFEWMPTATKNIQGTLERINQVLNIFPLDFTLTAEQNALIQSREEARQSKDWPRSDSLREELAAQNIEVEDTPTGPFAKPLL